MARLILFPVPIGADDIDVSLPPYNASLLFGCRHFIVEEIRTARRFLKHAGYPHPIDDDLFSLLNEHTPPEDITHYLDPIANGEDVGLLSEAGLPCVADPGVLVTSMAHSRGVEVLPLVGPSSLMLALMASGLDGQNFAFNGYLPVDRQRRAAAIHDLEARVLRLGQTQIFIEAPYRNNQMLQALAECCRPNTMICVACDLTLPTQTVRTLPAHRWRNELNNINLHKRNTVFLIGM